jgi:uncharacterized protein (TIGR02118 family)
MTVVYITYSGDESTRFDRGYYRNHHLPLVMKCWKQHGLESLSVLYPEDLAKGTIAICECKFRDDAAIKASFESEETPQVMADVKHFTDVTPTQTRAVPL